MNTAVRCFLSSRAPLHVTHTPFFIFGTRPGRKESDKTHSHPASHTEPHTRTRTHRGPFRCFTTLRSTWAEVPDQYRAM